jgi:hypothetical protein
VILGPSGPLRFLTEQAAEMPRINDNNLKNDARHSVFSRGSNPRRVARYSHTPNSQEANT